MPFELIMGNRSLHSESRSSTDGSVAIGFEKVKIRAARAPSVFLRGVLRGKISDISADYGGGA